MCCRELTAVQYIKQNAYNHLVTTGSEGKFGEAAFKEIHSISTIDFACAHVRIPDTHS